MADDQSDSKFSRRNFLEVSSGALAGAGVSSVANMFAQDQSSNGATKPGSARDASEPGPKNAPLDSQNTDSRNPPPTDAGGVQTFKYPFSIAHKRLHQGGWSREVTVRELAVSTTMAGVDMRLTAGGVRELHWHTAAEWAYMLYGSARITAIDPQGYNFVDDVGVGDLWYFPAGVPHSIQGLGPDGCEFLLVFDDGSFDEDNTFLITDWFKHTPTEVLAKNFGAPATAFGHTPDPSERYIFPAPIPGSLESDKIAGATPAPQIFSHKMLAQEPIRTKSGTVRITDSKVFPVSTRIAAALVEIEPGGMRELHWHPNTNEWQYYIEGQARMGVFGASGQARTFDYRAGDVGYIPFAMGHYIENTGDTRLRFLEIFRSSYYADVSLDQWMALTPPALVEAHLNLDQQVMSGLRKQKAPIVPA
jgi:oxalate decarboxylase